MLWIVEGAWFESRIIMVVIDMEKGTVLKLQVWEVSREGLNPN